MRTKQLLRSIGLADLDQGFIEADEDLFADLSLVRVSMIRDVHDDSIELKVMIYGQAANEDDPPVLESWIDPEVVMPLEELVENGVSPTHLRNLFANDVLGILLTLGIQILWLCEDGSWLPLNLADDGNDGVRLEPVDQ